MMATNFAVVFEEEDSGVMSAYVPGLPVYAQGATMAAAGRAISRLLAEYLVAHPEARPTSEIKVATVRMPTRTDAKPNVSIVSPAAFVGSRTSARKAASSRANGRLGGRPRLTR